MSEKPGGRPDKTEYAPYYDTYVSLVPEGDIVAILQDQLASTTGVLSAIPEGRAVHSYGEGKWTVAQVIGHMIDTERVFTQRALWFARGDEQPLPGMEQDDWAARANHSRRSLESLVREYRHLRSANIALFESFDDATLDSSGTASDCRFTVRALTYIIAGHERHHMRVLQERYL